MLELERWIRQIPLFEKGPVDQSRIASAKVAVVGAGGLEARFFFTLLLPVCVIFSLLTANR